MRGILNKLTPEKFGKLVDTVKTMPINTTERLSAVIDLIFEKVGCNLFCSYVTPLSFFLMFIML